MTLSAFTETPARSLTSLVINHDTEVVVAINTNGLYVIDPLNVVVLLGLKLEELSWDYAKPSQENNEDCLPCLFIQFCVIENGRRVSKILQIFSRQAVQMDALINTFVDELKQRVAMYNEDHEGNVYGDSTSTDADGTYTHFYLIFEFRSALLFKKRKKKLCSKNSVKSHFCVLLFESCFYLKPLKHAFIHDFTVGI